MPPRKARKGGDSAPRRSTRRSKVTKEQNLVTEESTIEETQLNEALKSEPHPVTSDVTTEAIPNDPSLPPAEPEEVERTISSPVAGTSSSGILTKAQENQQDDVEMDSTESVIASKSKELPRIPAPPAMTMEERQAKLEALRSKMRLTAQANRTELVEEHNRQKISAREQIRLERQRKLAEILREKADAEEAGDDLERRRNWDYSIEENDEWEKRLKRKAGRADFQFHDANDAARRKYKKDLDLLKPDLAAYNRQKEAALGLVPGALSKLSKEEQSRALAQVASSSTSVSAALAAEDLYRDANTLQYGDNKPSEEAIDRVVAKLNIDLDKRGKFSRKRLNEDEGDITYINEHNRVFNKKIARYYDKYTKEIRDSFERGTAL